MKHTALVTGASRGIGAATAIALAQNGYNVAVNYNQSKAAADSLVSELINKGFSACTFKADVSRESEVGIMFDEIKKVFGGVDILINNAAIAEQKLFTDITEADWNHMFDINTKGVFLCCRYALSHMIHQKMGKIVNISSMWGQTGGSCEVHYSASKAAVIGLTKALAKELGPSGITVNCISPGVIDTDMNAHLSASDISALIDETPLCRIGTPEDIAKLVLFLTGDGGNFITGQIFGVNGGILI